MEVVRVLLVDDQAPFLRAMRAVVNETDGFEVVGEASSGEESIRVTPMPGRRPGSTSRSNTPIRYGERLAEIGAIPSIGTVADSYDNVLAETVNGYYKAELIRGPARDGRRWKTVEDVELATLSWVHWHNTQRLYGYLGDVPPAEFEG